MLHQPLQKYSTERNINYISKLKVPTISKYKIEGWFLVFLIVLLFIPASGIDVLVVGRPRPCVSKTLLAIFLLLLDCISFGNYPGVNGTFPVDKIGSAVNFPIRLWSVTTSF